MHERLDGPWAQPFDEYVSFACFLKVACHEVRAPENEWKLHDGQGFAELQMHHDSVDISSLPKPIFCHDKHEETVWNVPSFIFAEEALDIIHASRVHFLEALRDALFMAFLSMALFAKRLKVAVVVTTASPQRLNVINIVKGSQHVLADVASPALPSSDMLFRRLAHSSLVLLHVFAVLIHFVKKLYTF
jgi:hypothetical protein